MKGRRLLTLFLALCLVSAPILSTTALAGTNENADHTEALSICEELNVLNGYQDNTIRPAENVKRAELCKMISVVMNGGKTPTNSTNAIPTFSDIRGTAAEWAEGYIEYCYGKGVVSGVGTGLFNPQGKVTYAEAVKMMLVTLGYGASDAGLVGAGWKETALALGQEAGLDKGLTGTGADDAMLRGEAAQLINNGLQANTVIGTVDADRVTYAKTDKTLVEAAYDIDLYTGVMTHISRNEETGLYTYAIRVTGGEQSGAIRSVTSETDYSALYAMSCMIYNRPESLAALGIFACDSLVVLSGVAGELGGIVSTDTFFQQGNVKYKLNTTFASLPAYAFNDYRNTGAGNINQCFAYKMIDNDADGEIDCVVYYPYSVGKIDSLGDVFVSLSTTFGSEIGGGRLSELNRYDGMAVGDFVRVTPAANTVNGKKTLEKIETFDGTVAQCDTAAARPWAVIGGETYGLMPGVSGIEAGAELTEIVAVNGWIFSKTPLIFYVPDWPSTPPTAAPDPLLEPLPVALLASYNPGGTPVGDEKPTFATISILTTNKGQLNGSTADYSTELPEWKGKLVAYSLENGVYTLYPCDADYAAAMIGYSAIIAAPAPIKGGTSAITADYSFVDHKPLITPKGGTAIGFAENAIVLVVDGANAVSITTAAELVNAAYTVVNAYTNPDGTIALALLYFGYLS